MEPIAGLLFFAGALLFSPLAIVVSYLPGDFVIENVILLAIALILGILFAKTGPKNKFWILIKILYFIGMFLFFGCTLALKPNQYFGSLACVLPSPLFTLSLYLLLGRWLWKILISLKKP